MIMTCSRCSLIICWMNEQTHWMDGKKEGWKERRKKTLHLVNKDCDAEEVKYAISSFSVKVRHTIQDA